MRKIFFIALMLSFLVGNAQQDRQQFGPNSSIDPEQLYMENHPGYPSEIDLNRYAIRKPDYTGYPVYFDVNKNKIKKPDNTGYPVYFDVNKNKIKKPDYTGYPIYFDLYRYKVRKTN